MEDQIANAPQTIEDRAWMKRVLHLAGGNGDNERRILSSKLDAAGMKLEDNAFIADLTSFSKQSQDVIDGLISEQILNLINTGLMIKTYFGHGGVTTTQFNGFEDPVFLDNKDRYPLMIALGCHTGDVFQEVVSLSESNVLIPDKGGSIYVATSGLGYLSALEVFVNDWYTLLGSSHYHLPLSESFVEVIRRNDQNENAQVKTLMQQSLFHGDPGFRIFRYDGPDYTIDHKSLLLDPAQISVDLESFSAEFDIVNIGMNKFDSLEITTTFISEDDDQILSVSKNKILHDQFRKNYKVQLVTPDRFQPGTYRLEIRLNDSQEIIEIPDPRAYQNNELFLNGTRGLSFSVIESNVRQIWPPDFGIVGKTEVQLVAYDVNSEVTENSYFFELDTCPNFDSPLLQSNRIRSLGGSISSTFQISDSEQVYYWRTYKDSLQNKNSNRSFLYQQGTESGWNQSHYYQWIQDISGTIGIDSTSRRFNYPSFASEIQIFNRLNNAGDDAAWFVNGNNTNYIKFWNKRANISFNVVYFDPLRLSISNNPSPGDFGSINNTGARVRRFSFNFDSQEGRANFISFLEEGIPEKYYVFIYSQVNRPDQEINPSDWLNDTMALSGTSVFTIMEKQGAVMFSEFSNHDVMVPYAFAYQNNIGSIEEHIASEPNETIELNAPIFGSRDNGELYSPTVGPVKAWNSLHYSIPSTFSDSISVILQGSDDGEVFTTIHSFASREIDFELDDIDDSFLRLGYFSNNITQRTPNTIAFWRMQHAPLPDLTFAEFTPENIGKDSMPVGTNLSVSFRMINLSPSQTDSIPVQFELQDQSNVKQIITKKYSGLNHLDDLEVLENIVADELTGEILLTVHIDPDNTIAESETSNNILLKKYCLLDDVIDPVIDVTFDGIRIMDGDIVSPTPLIRIDLNDENSNRFISDTSAFSVRLRLPDGNLKNISQDEIISFIKGDNENGNTASLSLAPQLPVDGSYTLLINGKDAANNPAGRISFEKSFEVIHQTSLSNILPFPNPFSTSTRFLYTLTGAQPDHFLLQILSVNGSVIREIDLTDFGPLKIGTHLSEFIWDGTDEYGDPLANGIYLYRCRISKEGEDYEHFEQTSVDPFFSKDLGKVVILR